MAITPATIVTSRMLWLFVHTHMGVWRGSPPRQAAIPLSIVAASVGVCIALVIAASAVRRAAPRLHRRSPTLRWCDSIGRVGTLAGIAASITWLVGASFGAWPGPSDHETQVATLVCLLGGMTLALWAGVRYRGPVSCAACAYHVRTMRGSGHVCPECGAPWKRPRGTRRWRTLSRNWLIAAIVLIDAGLLLMASAER